jgi:hypothetical protein
MPRKHKKSNKRVGKQFPWVKGLLASAMVAVLLGAGGGLMHSGRACNQLDANLCRACNESEAVIAIGIDSSGAFTPRQRQAVRNAIFEAITLDANGHSFDRALARNDRLEVYLLNARGDELLEPVITRCNPGRPEGLEVLFENERRAQRLYELEFFGAIEFAIDDLASVEESNASPIVESIAAMAETAFVGRDQGQINTMLVISDMLQNSPNWSFYSRGVTDYSGFRESVGYAASRVDLRAANVCFLRISRATMQERAMQTPRMLDWWADYVADNDGEYAPICETEFRL